MTSFCFCLRFFVSIDAVMS